MGHRHVFSPSYMFETENDQRWNLTDHSYAHIAHSGNAETSSHTYSADNMSINGAQYPASNTYSSLPENVHNPHHQHDAAAGPSDPSSVRGFYTVPENYTNAASSSNYNGNHIHEDDPYDVRSSNGRWRCKRKSPIMPSDDTWEESRDIDFLHTRWDWHNGGESSDRNVRSRTALDLEASHTRTPVSNDNYTTSRSMDVSSSGNLVGQTTNGSTREWNPTHMPSSIHDSIITNTPPQAEVCMSNRFNLKRSSSKLGFESSSLGSELNPLLVGTNNSNSNASEENGGHNNGSITRSNNVSRSVQVQSIRGNRINYSQRSTPTFRASSSSLQLENSDEALQLTTDNYSSRPLPTIAWRSNDQNGRARILINRFRSFHEEASFHDRSAPEGVMIVDGSRHPFDDHRDMRLDIDDMSYEELLALGERIGSVSTGLSEKMISECLRESIYCSSDQIQEEATCVICLEEYANMDDVGMLKGCKHDFHVGCIKKWLSMKNLCPICKSEPIKHN